MVTRTVDSHVPELRQRIEPDPADPVHTRTVRKVGYRFERSGDPARLDRPADRATFPSMSNRQRHHHLHRHGGRPTGTVPTEVRA